VKKIVVRSSLLPCGLLQPVPKQVVFLRQQGFKLRPAASRQILMVTSQKIFQQHIEFFHSAPAQPPEFFNPDSARLCHFAGRLQIPRRAMSIFLVSAMALAGFSPLGQVLVQFMMVWQRYSLNGSSRSSSLSPVASSLESASQR